MYIIGHLQRKGKQEKYKKSINDSFSILLFTQLMADLAIIDV